MSGERIKNDAAGTGFDVEYTAEEKRERHLGLGQRIKNIFNKDKEYLLTEHMPKDKKGLKDLYRKKDKTNDVKMPLELGKYLESLVNDPNYWVGVHRSSNINGEAFENDETLQSIMKEGLKNYGDASSGSFRVDPAITKTVSHCPEMFHMVMYTKGLRSSTGVVLLAIPSEYIDEHGNVIAGHENDVYDHDEDGYSLIKPEYMKGFIQNLGKGSTLQFKSREEILEAAKKGE